MPLTSSCHNCGISKTQDYYAENYCEVCTKAYNESRSKAREDGLNPGDAGREVLAQLAHDVHRNRPDPRFPMTKADYWTAQAPKETK